MKKAEDRDRGDDESPKRYGNEKPISLYPLTPEEALKRAMSAPLPKKSQRQAKRHKPSE